ncbi:MAG: ArsR/SmtB family transcription factor [Micromonosporaceae bacterium]
MSLGVDEDLDAVFKALADSSRRLVLDKLRERNGQTLNELCRPLEMTRQATSKHLAILEAAGLVTTVRRGREKWHYLNPVPINQIHERWISRYEQHRLDALATLKHALQGADERPDAEPPPPNWENSSESKENR